MTDPAIHKYLFKISYDGTAYGGWQIQQNAPSIQATIEHVLQKILQEKISLTGSGRTDAGVHALSQTAHFTTSQILLESKILYSLNQLLPPDIRILEMKPVPIDFHARYSASSKVYQYQLHLHPVRSPFLYPFAYHPPYKIDLDQLKRCLPYFIGKRDFTSFAHEAHTGSCAKNPIRTLMRLELIEIDEGIALLFEGDGFLYKMVRNITGTLLDICAGKIKEEEIPLIFDAKDRKKAGKTAPPHGLFLVQVNYNNNEKLSNEDQ